MFWRKKKKTLEDTSEVVKLAAKLGVERRQNVRVRYPSRANVCKLPEVAFQGEKLFVQDISVGGCCILDPKEFLGPSIGQDIVIELIWSTGVEKVPARIVARVDERRHIQFSSLAENRKTHLKKYMTAGVRGDQLRKHEGGAQPLMATEIWSSLVGDTLTLETDLNRSGTIFLLGEEFELFQHALPRKKLTAASCSRLELEQMILFLANVRVPSKGLRILISALEDLHFDMNSKQGESA